MTALLLADHDGTALTVHTAKALTAARAAGGTVDVLVAGSAAGSVADAASRLEGVGRVLVARDCGYPLAEPVATLIASLAPGYDAIVSAASSTGKNVLPRVAALLDVMQVSDVTEVVGPDIFKRTIYAGNAVQTVRSMDPIKVLTVRTGLFAAAQPGAGVAPILPVAVPADPGMSFFEGHVLSASARPELGAARVVVSGGRALGSAERFQTVLSPLADRLGAALGASRAAVDAGYAPNDLQVGQTGKVIAPDFYIACGVSGAIQHLAGMKDSRVIVAINTDPDAPIFRVADYGIVGDVFDVVPALEYELR